MSNDNHFYQEEDLLLLSGIQHIAFCERQWALIHLEQAWAENVRTVEGKYLHERTDDVFGDESRGNVRIVRAMPIISHRLGLRGVADVVEFRREEEKQEGRTVTLENRRGWWSVHPVEYKRGRPKKDDRDAVQLCAQAVALEEMLGISIDSGYLFYWETRHRESIDFEPGLRDHVFELCNQMHMFANEGTTPRANRGKRCSLCSLIELCQPNLTIKHRSVSEYISGMIKPEVKDF